MLNKRKESNSYLRIDKISVQCNNKENNLFTVPLLSLIAIVFVFCISQIAIQSFKIFNNVGIGSFGGEISGKSLRDFWIAAIIGCTVICILQGLKKHSTKLTLCTLLALFAYFTYNYKLVANGFVYAVNKVNYSILTSQGKTAVSYYFTPFTSTDAEKELKIFCLAVVWGTCFLVACAVVRYCNPVILTSCLVLYSAPPLAYFTFVGELYLITAAICCLTVLIVRVSGYRSFYIKPKQSRVGKVFKIHGRTASNTAVQQAVSGILAIVIITLGITAIYDVSEYKRNEDVEKLSKDIFSSVQNIVTTGFSFKTDGGLNNGQIYNTGNLEYTGKTMFRLKSDAPSYSKSIYLRSYTAAEYDGKRWSELTKKKYRNYDAMWNRYKDQGIFPQFMHSYLNDIISPSDSKYNIDIINENINNKLFLTSPDLVVDNSQDLTKSVTNYDNAFYIDSFSGIDSYSQSAMYSYTPNLEVYAEPETIGDNIQDTLYNCNFYTSIPIDILTSSSSEIYDDLKSFYELEKQYRKFVIDNYTAYPEIIDELFPAEFDLNETYNSVKNTGNYVLSEEPDGMTAYFSTYTDTVPNPDIINSYYSTVIAEITEYLHKNAEYTLSPGSTPYGKDFVDYFINENHKGYCVHFATSATLMLRKAGIPARYVEGYFVSEQDLKNTDENGYISVPDSRAHAWTEVYFPLYGWTVVDFTPSYGINGEIPPENDEWNTDSETKIGISTDTEKESDTDTSSDAEDSDNITSSDTTDSNLKAESNTGKIPKAIKTVLASLCTVFAAAALWLFIRIIAIKLREYRFKASDTRKAAGFMYSYSLRLYKCVGITMDKYEGEQSFAQKVCRELDCVDKIKYKKFTDMALSARFGKTSPDRKSIEEMNVLIKDISASILKSVSKSKKFIIKYVLFLQ